MRSLALILLLAIPAPAADEWKGRWFDLVARATALISTSRHMEDRLAGQGLRLRAETVAARVRVEMAMDAAESAYESRRDAEIAAEFARADELLKRFERALH